jgi:hypothetical protein
MIGQPLYLAAEAAGVRGTGIGCYFDDVLHRALGLMGHDWQSPLLHRRSHRGPAPVHSAAMRASEDGRWRNIKPKNNFTLHTPPVRIICLK